MNRFSKKEANMSLSEFRWNKKRKHYAYLFKNRKGLVFDLIITTKPYRLVHGKIKTNFKLFRHPNPLSNKTAYVIPFIYIDTLLSFYEKVYKWSFNANDIRKIKRLKRLLKRKKKSQL